MVEIVCTKHFLKALEKMQAREQRQVEEKIALLVRDPGHNSLNAHRMQVGDHIWECYANEHVRIIYEMPHSDTPLRLWYVGQHGIVDGAERLGFRTSRFRTYALDAEAPGDLAGSEPTPAFTPNPAWSAPAQEAPEDIPIGDDGLLAVFPAAQLRFFGVPLALVSRVQAVSYSHEFDQIAGLPDQTVAFLRTLLDTPKFSDVFFNPELLMYRTTLDAIEGFCEGQLKQLMLNLTPPQQRLVDEAMAGMAIVRGTAGSGKTTVGVYRAIARAKAGHRVALISFNATLVEALRTLVRELEGEIPRSLVIETADALLRQTMRVIAPHTQVTIAQKEDRLYAMRQGINVTAGAYDLRLRDGGHFLDDELEAVVYARGLTTWAEYRDVSRAGRGTALGKSARRVVWEISQAYQATLARMGLMEWHMIAQQVRDHSDTIPASVRFDDIIVDETQDVSLVKLQALARLIKDDDHTTFWLLTDAAQTIYSRGIWWGDDDISRTPQRYYLRRNHRNTRQIAEAAATLLAQNTRRFREFPAIAPDRTLREGLPPAVVRCASLEAQMRWIRDRIQDLCDGSTLRYSDFVVLCHTREICRQAAATLEGAQIPVQTQDGRLDLLENTVKVLTFHSAKGLEWPAVFIAGVDAGLMPLEAALRGLENEERDREIERERSLLYVACTRAATMLTILATSSQESPFLADFGDTVHVSDA
jgi:superfamily I DNA/RNA helicase/mRNA-degrading endonuclease YafQ of YafQ-DinJ toxin-antitoxin module